MARPAARRSAERRDPLAQSQAQPAATVMEQVRVELLYDYSLLPAQHRTLVEEAARLIKPRLRRAAEDIFVIGAALNGVQARLEYGQFGEWLAVEFGLSRRMGQHFMNVATRLKAKSEKFALLPPSALYLLAAPSTPDAAIVEVEEKLDAGDRVQVARVEAIVEAAKQRARLAVAAAAAEAGRSIEGFRTLEAVERAQAESLLALLDEVVGKLAGAPAKQWAAIFRNSELSRVRNELAGLRRQLAARLEGEDTPPESQAAGEEEEA